MSMPTQSYKYPKHLSRDDYAPNESQINQGINIKQ